MHIEQGLSFYNRYLVGIGVKCVDVQFITSGLEVNIAERLKAADGKFWEFYEYAAVAGESLKVDMALTVEVRTHLLNLKIRHIAKALGKSAFMISLAGESESFNQTPPWEKLCRRADEFRKTKVICKNTYHVRAAGHPDERFILVSLYSTLLINTEKLRMKRPLIKGEGQLADNNVRVRKFHYEIHLRFKKPVISYAVILPQTAGQFKAVISTDNAVLHHYGTMKT